ncbi:MAG: RpiB/LacA/LacB family sugar-phosphate isomerase, partial [Desulfobacterales bacterium]
MPEKKAPIIIGCDHAAFALKEAVKAYLVENGITVRDAGTHATTSVDYPDFGARVAAAVS